MSKRKIVISSSDSAPDLNLNILLSTPYDAALPARNPNKKKKLKSSSVMDARVPDRDRQDDDDDEDSPATSESSSDVINTEEDPFPRNSCSFNKTTAAAASSALIFDILRREGRRSPDAAPIGGNSNPPPTIHQLFPETSSGGGAGSELNLLAAAAAPNQWLRLSEAAAAVGVIAGGGEAPAAKPRKSRRGPRSRSSQYRGVTFYRRTGRWESHIWDCGKQVYLGGFDTAHAAARAYDRAAIKFRGVEADINFNLGDYDQDMKATKDLSKEEFVHVLRRQSTGFSRGSSKYRAGVTLQKCGRWEAPILPNNNNKAYDKAAMEYSGSTGVLLTNFQPSEFHTNTCVMKSGREDDLDLRLGMSPRKNSTTMEARVPLVDKTSSSRGGPPALGFQGPLHGLPVNLSSPKHFSTWQPPPPPSAFDPEMRQSRVVVQGSNIPFLATSSSSSSWANQHQLNSSGHRSGAFNSDDNVNNVNAGVPKWPLSTQQHIAASSGFLSSSSNNNNNSNNRANAGNSAAGGSSSSSPNANIPFQTNQQYWYSHNKRAQ